MSQTNLTIKDGRAYKVKYLNAKTDVLNSDCSDLYIENQMLNIDDSVLEFHWNSLKFDLKTKLI